MDWKMTLLNEREKGALLERIDTVVKKIQKGQDLPEAAAAMEKDVEELRPIWEAVEAAAPEYDRDMILRTIQ